ncbi:MAG: hypothetical protein ACLP5H_01780 [Desulfomonilaceae bacterium]
MESMPFLHANQVFNIFFLEDLAFAEVRAILDQLLARNAFDLGTQETQGFYQIDLGESSFQVWVSEMDVIIERQ